MSRTPIIMPGQVYLNSEINEYLVVVHSNRGDISFRGQGFNGRHDYERFLERFGPVNPEDLTEDEEQQLMAFLGEGLELSTGWVEPDEEDLECY